MKKSVLIFSITKLDEMLQKGNMTYVKNYEVFFDRVYQVYLFGKNTSVKVGNTEFISLGTTNSYFDLLLAPIRLYRFMKGKNIQIVFSAELLFSWWISFLIRGLLGVKVFLIPVAMPHVIYESSGRTITGVLPRFVEKLLIRLSFRSSYRVITAKNIQQYIEWLQSIPSVSRKLLTVDVMVDSLPGYDFFRELGNKNCHPKTERNVLLYVGRLHKEKLVSDIVEAFYLLSSKKKDLELWLIGDGNEKASLQNICKKYKIEDRVKFLGSKKSEELVSFYKQATIFVSTLTGTALREAALSSTPVVCYEMDWVQGTFTHNKELLFAEKNNIKDLSRKIEELLDNDKLYTSIVYQMDKYANEHWSLESIKTSLETIYLEGT